MRKKRRSVVVIVTLLNKSYADVETELLKLEVRGKKASKTLTRKEFRDYPVVYGIYSQLEESHIIQTFDKPDSIRVDLTARQFSEIEGFFEPTDEDRRKFWLFFRDVLKKANKMRKDPKNWVWGKDVY